MVSLDGSVHALTNSNRALGIVVYTSSSCQKCSALKEWLKAANRHFEERSLENVDVMTDLVMRNVVVLSAPVLEVENTIYTEDQLFEGNSLSVNRLLGILEGQ
jgi:arsenate reductase-like glutaredoxin family protein